MSKMTLPTAEQAEKLRSAGIDPDKMVILVDNREYLWCMNLKTRDEITVRFNKTMWRENGRS